MNKKDVEIAKKGEAQFFNRVANIRDSKDTVICQEVDIRRATKYIPKNGEKFHVTDPHMMDLLSGKSRDKYIELVAHKKGGRVLDLGCGSGWLALELARNGQVVDAYDLSAKAIALAKKTLKDNPYKKGFGKINYYNKDVSEIDLGVNKYDAISGWSAFHHMPDANKFLAKAYRALKPGGVIATYDDMERGWAEPWLEYFFEFILPVHTLTYKQKLIKLFKVMRGKESLRQEIFSPMEELKHSAVVDIEEDFYDKYEVLYFNQENAFCGLPCMRVIGPDSFRYSAARIVMGIDYFLCKIGLVKGFDRVIVARKSK